MTTLHDLENHSEFHARHIGPNDAEIHERSAFEDDPARPRLLYRARYVERIAGTERAWAGNETAGV